MRPSVFAAVIAAAAAGCGSPTPPPIAALPVVISPESGLTPDKRVESPGFTRWAKFPVGTVVVFDETTKAPETKSVTVATYKLAEKTADVAVVETTGSLKTAAGQGPATEPQALRHVKWMGKPAGEGATDPGRPAGTFKTGTETVTVRGKEYKAKWYKSKGHVEAGETETTTWFCDDVPGAMVKSVYSVPAAKKTVTAELVEIKTP